jgi:hypothetical protein
VFDIHQHRSGTERVTESVNITEHRAPTDESVRLLREIEAEAQKKILASIRVQNTPVDTVIQVFEDWPNDKTVFRMVYKLKGLRHEVKHEVASMGFGKSPEDICMELRDALAKDIANNLLGPMMTDLNRQGIRLFNR